MDERPIRRAASVVCVRAGDGRGSPRCSSFARSPESRFLPGYVAFPGGAVDADDEAHAERWFGDPAHAARAAAVRELVEEAGVTLTADGLVAADGLRTDRRGSARGSSRLSALCHWVAPPEVPVRFDARYFTDARAGADVATTPDGAEVTRICGGRRRAGSSPSGGRGAHKLYWPTWFTVTELAACTIGGGGARAVASTARDPTPDEEATMPRHVMEQE